MQAMCTLKYSVKGLGIVLGRVVVAVVVLDTKPNIIALVVSEPYYSEYSARSCGFYSHQGQIMMR